MSFFLPGKVLTTTTAKKAQCSDDPAKAKDDLARVDGGPRGRKRAMRRQELVDIACG